MECNLFIKDGISREIKKIHHNQPTELQSHFVTLDARRVLDLGLQELQVHESQLQPLYLEATKQHKTSSWHSPYNLELYISNVFTVKCFFLFESRKIGHIHAKLLPSMSYTPATPLAAAHPGQGNQRAGLEQVLQNQAGNEMLDALGWQCTNCESPKWLCSC